MEDLDLLEILYKQLALHSSDWKEDLTSVNFLIQETHKSSGKPRPEVIHLFRVLEHMEMFKLISKDPLAYKVNYISLEELKTRLAKGSIASYGSTDLFQVLDLIENRPGMFLTEPRLDYLYMFLSGYKFASTGFSEKFENIEKLQEFSSYLENQFALENKNSMSWYGILCNQFNSGNEGLLKFYEYMWKFRMVENAS